MTRKSISINIALAALITTSTSASANEEVFSALSKEITEWTARFGEKTEQCNARKKANTPNPLSLETLNSNSISMEDAVTAVAYIASRNSYLRDEHERIRYAFVLGTLNAAFKEYGINPTMQELGLKDDSIEELQAGLVYPSMLYLEMSADYVKLSPDVQEFFEEMFGTEPFDAIRVLDPLPRH